MAGTPKKKKLEKVKTDDEVIVPSQQKFYCYRCGRAYSRIKGCFPVSHSPMYRGVGYLPVCTDCVESMYESYYALLGSEKAAMKRLCMKFDLYWNDDIFTMADKTSGLHSKARNYIGKTNLYRYIDKSYDDTIVEEENLAKNSSESAATVNTVGGSSVQNNVEEYDENDLSTISKDIIDFWGPGYTRSMYEALDQRRAYWMGRLPEDIRDDIGTEALVRQLCNLELDINRDRAAGKPIEKSINAFNALLGSMNLKPTQKKDDADSILEKTPFGVWIAKWENEQPIPEPDPELKDVDGIIKYILTWLYGHLAKMLNIKNAHSKLYDEAIERLRVEHPEYDDEDDEDLLYDIFSTKGNTVEQQEEDDNDEPE